MIKINLLGKKKAAAGGVPFGLDELFSKLGVSGSEFSELRPDLVRFAILLTGVYLASEVPFQLHERKKAELRAQNVQLEQTKNELNAKIAAKKAIQEEMRRLENDERELRRQLAAIQNLQKDRSLAFRALDNLVVTMPQSVWLNKFEYKEQKISLSGSCWEYFPINDFIKKISESTQYVGVNFSDISANPPAKTVSGVPEAVQKIKTFGMTFGVKGSSDF